MSKNNSNSYKPFISVVIYVRNCQNYIADFIVNINNILKLNFENYELICVNDFSDDDTVNNIKAISKTDIDVPVTIVNLPKFHGNEYAMSAGVDIAIGDFVFEFEDAIADYDFEDIIRVYQRALDGYDIVSASRVSKSNFFSSIFYKILNRTSSLAELSTESFRVLSRRAINRIKSLTDQVIYRKAIYYSCGLKTDKIIYNPSKDIHRSSQSFLYKQQLAVDTLLVYSNFGYRVSLTLSITMMLFSILIMFYTIFIAIFKTSVVEGWLSMMLFLSLSFFGLFTISTIIIKYLSLIASKLYSKRNYIYESVEKVNKG